MTATHFGAQPEDWSHFDLILGLGEDLLPVVSNPGATISSQSKMGALGKTPSVYNRNGHAVGMVDWTSKKATPQGLDTWSKQPDYGICLQTRNVRAIDIDVADADLAASIVQAIGLTLPVRMRKNSSKMLMAFELPGDYTKRAFKCAHGIVEFLATGQQFIAIGTHPSGARYEWQGGLPEAFPKLTSDEFEKIWAKLIRLFAIEAPSERKATTKSATLAAAISTDPIVARLDELGLIKSAERDGRVHITCPFEDEHTGDTSESATTYWPAHTGGYELGNFRCLHAHCDHRSRSDFLDAIGLGEDPRDDFEAFDATLITNDENGETTEFEFPCVRVAEFSAGKPMGWWIKGILPKAELAVIYGPPGAGKSFYTLDMVLAIARGLPEWAGRKVHKARVVYVAAEGAGGFRNRLQAYAQHHQLEMSEIPMLVMPSTPNLMQRNHINQMVASMIAAGGVDIIVYDTLARGTVGADENSAKDMGVAIANCRKLHDKTGATVLLVHHSGKDPTRGARGSNAVLGAVDAEIEIARVDANRTATVSKLKDGEDGTQMGFTLKTIPIGMDEDGDVISSCVVEHGDVVVSSQRSKKLGNNEQRVWGAILELQDAGGELPGVEKVITQAAESMPFDTGSGKRDRRRELMSRALTNLCDIGKVAVDGGAVRICGAEQ